MRKLHTLLFTVLLLCGNWESFAQELVSSFVVRGDLRDDIVVRILVREVIRGDTTRFEPNIRWDGNVVFTPNGSVLVEDVVSTWRVVRTLASDPSQRTIIAITESPDQSFTDTTAQANTTYNYIIEGVEANFSSPALVVPIPDNTPIPPVAGGALSAGNIIRLCVGDGTPDFIDVRLRNNRGPNMAWVITNSVNTIIALPEDLEAFNFNGLDEDIYVAYNLSFQDDLTGLAVGNSLEQLAGTFDLSNGLAINALDCGQRGGRLYSRATTRFCVGDGVADNLVIELRRAAGDNSAWIITDEDKNIIGLPADPEAVDFDGAGVGRCFLYHISFEDGLTGLTLNANIDGLAGEFDLSNALAVNRVACEPAPEQDELVFPNPSAGVVNVRLDASEAQATVKIVSLTANQRETFYQEKWDRSLGNSMRVDVSGLPAGTHVAVIRYASGQIERVRFIKQ